MGHQKQAYGVSDRSALYLDRWLLRRSHGALTTSSKLHCALAGDILGVSSMDTWPIKLTPGKATVILLVVVDKPKSAPISCLVILVSVLVAHLIIRLNDVSGLQLGDLPSVLAIFAAFGAVAVILCMPLRDTRLPADRISAPFESPTRELRSPEDRLTPWQFMTVSWMKPLIGIGYKKQLNDDDVWSLGYEFQHKGLHETFRELKGSVVRRLLAANVIDLVILTALALVDLAGSK